MGMVLVNMGMVLVNMGMVLVKVCDLDEICDYSHIRKNADLRHQGTPK
jgi:hypothetical protein